MASAKQRHAKNDDLSNASSNCEKSWLQSRHHKLRHLYGITIRNVTLATDGGYSSKQTNDDEALPSALKSPTKLSNPKFPSRLGHASSSLNLQHMAIDERKKANGSFPEKGPVPKVLPGQLKRRITSEWIAANPVDRQRKLEEILDVRLVDTFFSLHVAEIQDPIYISEVIEKTANADYRFFDLTSHSSTITRQDEVIIRVWAKNEQMEDFQIVIEEKLNLSSLRYIGKGLSTYRNRLPDNCVLLYIWDGVYTSHPDIKAENSISSKKDKPSSKNHQSLPSSSYDTLMRLSVLDDCIQDALRTRDKLTDDITNILNKNKYPLGVVTRKSEVKEQIKATKDAIAAQRQILKKTVKRRDDMTTQLRMRRTAMERGRQSQKTEDENLHAAREVVTKTKQETEQLRQSFSGQQRRVCSNLASIYPIAAIPEKSLAFTICGLSLPKASFDSSGSSHDDTVAAAALGHVAQVVCLLSLYLSCLLPYPTTPMSSTSSIIDAPAMTSGARTYPLFPRSGPRFRYEYGVFLLNKNIEVLTTRLEGKILDIRHTLANLKFALYLATAGEGDLPARKAGGVKGLLLNKSMAVAALASAAVSPSGSISSLGSVASAATGRARARAGRQGHVEKEGGDGDGGSVDGSVMSDAGSERNVFRPNAPFAENGSAGSSVDGPVGTKGANGDVHGLRGSAEKGQQGGSARSTALKDGAKVKG